MWKRILTAVLAIALLALVVGQARKPRHGRTERYYKAEEVRPMAGPHTWISNTGVLQASGFDTGLLPAAGEVMICDPRASNHGITGNLGALAAVNLGRLHTRFGYKGSLGVQGSPLRVGAGTFLIQGDGTVYWDQEGDVAQTVFVDSPNLVEAFRWVESARTGVRLYVRSGRVFVESGVEPFHLTTMFPLRGTHPAHVTIRPSATTFANAVCRAGLVENFRTQGADFTTEIEAGEWFDHNGDLRKVFVSGGTFVSNGVSTPDEIDVSGGVLDLTQDFRERTINVVRMFPGGGLEKNPEVTITSLLDYREAIPNLKAGL